MAPLNWKLLTAFEAVARHRNFSRAAGELNVQQPAVSRRVAALETELGVTLLRRTRPRTTLTKQGEQLYGALTGAVTQVRGALEEIGRRPDDNVVTVNTTIGFASCYLMKRLSGFRSANPQIAIELVSRDQNDAYGEDGADIVTVFDHPDRLPGARQAKIFPETLVAVSTPALAEEIGDDLETLSRQTLLHLTIGIHGDDWRTYFDQTGLAAPPPASDQRFTSFMVYLQAALNGDGIILGWETLLRDQFDIGQLAPIGTRRISTARGYFACLTARAIANPAAVLFWEWLAGLEERTTD